MEQEASADSWLARRMMKLTPFEKRAMDMPERVRKTQSAAMRLFDQISLPPPSALPRDRLRTGSDDKVGR